MWSNSITKINALLTILAKATHSLYVSSHFKMWRILDMDTIIALDVALLRTRHPCRATNSLFQAP